MEVLVVWREGEKTTSCFCWQVLFKWWVSLQSERSSWFKCDLFRFSLDTDLLDSQQKHDSLRKQKSAWGEEGVTTGNKGVKAGLKQHPTTREQGVISNAAPAALCYRSKKLERRKNWILQGDKKQWTGCGDKLEPLRRRRGGVLVTRVRNHLRGRMWRRGISFCFVSFFFFVSFCGNGTNNVAGTLLLSTV